MNEEKVHYRSCSICEAMCGLEITTRGEEIAAIRGDKMDRLSRGHICPKVTAIKELYNDPDRLKRPVRRTRNGWVKITWKETIGDRHFFTHAGYDSVSNLFHRRRSVPSIQRNPCLECARQGVNVLRRH